MNKKTKTRIIIYSSVLMVALFFIFGRQLWYPVYIKIRGRYSLEDVYNKYGIDAENRLVSVFKKKSISYPPEHVTLIALKSEKILEVWIKEKGENRYLNAYSFTGYSGTIGPKLKEGDFQIPEGIYRIDFLNPNSKYHLSMKINYPNNFDILMAKNDNRKNLGGDIFIHGGNVTIGCIPIGDENIEVLFTLIYKTCIQRTKVIISPYDMRKYQKNIINKNVGWLDKLYEKIKSELKVYKKTDNKSLKRTSK